MLTDILSRGASGSPLADLVASLNQATAELTAIRRSLDRQAPTQESAEIITIAFGSDTAPYQVSEQLRVLSITVWATLAGQYTLQRGSDTSIRFLANPNAPTPVTNGEAQTIVLARGLPLTIVPAAAISTAVWYVLMSAVPGVNAFKQNP